MKLSALAALNDLRRSRGLVAKGKKGKLDVRSMKAPAKNGPSSKVIVRMNGLGDATAASLVREAEVACRFLISAQKSFIAKKYHAALDSYFKAAAMASNVLFTSNTQGVPILPAIRTDMCQVIEHGTLGIKNVMKMIALKSVRRHNRKMHKKGSK